jgi:hypothetical protein
MLDTYLQPSGGLAVPGGGSVADPYASATWEFAGVKMLTVATTENRDWGWMQQNALQPLLDAGYQARVFRYQATSPGFVAQIDVGETLKGRAALEAGVILKQQGWKVRTGEATRGNRGAYDHAATTYVGTIDEVILQDTTHQKRNDVMHASVVLTPDPSSPTAYLDAAPPTRTRVTGDLTTLLASGTPVMWWLCSGTSAAPGEAWVDIVPALGNYAVMWTGPQSGTKDCQSSYVDSQGVVHTSATTEQMHFLPVMCSGMPLTDPAHLQGSCTVTSPEGRAETLTWDLVRAP